MTTFDKSKPVTITLGGDIRFIFPSVFEKRVNNLGEDKYEVCLQIPYENKKAIALFNDAVDEAVRRGFSGDLKPNSTFKKGTKEKDLALPLHDGEDKEETDYADLFAGYMYANAKSSRKPTLVDVNGQEIIDPEEFYAGVIGAVNVTLYPYNNRSQGIGVQLNHIMKIADGERLSGGFVSVEDAFKDYVKPVEHKERSRMRDGVPSRGRTPLDDLDDELS